MSEKQEQIENEETESAVNAETDNSAGSGGESVNDDNIAGLEKQLEEALSKAEQNLELALRAKAELENATRRHQQDLEKAHKLSLIHISEPTRQLTQSRIPSSA